MSESNFNQNINALLPDAFAAIEYALNDPEVKTSDKLRAAQILGKWGGLEKGNLAPVEEVPDLESYLKTMSRN